MFRVVYIDLIGIYPERFRQKDPEFERVIAIAFAVTAAVWLCTIILETKDDLPAFIAES